MGTYDFIVAARVGDVETVRRGLEEGVNINAKGLYGDTALHKACGGGHYKVVELLIKNGVDHNMTNLFGDKALHEACRRGHDKVVELLIKNGADLNVTNKAGNTALHFACRGGHDKVVELLIKNGSDLNVPNKDGDTALYHACGEGHDNVVKLLIKNGAYLNVANKAENTALHKACINEHDKVVELLIKNGAKLNKTDKFEETFLQEACSGGHHNIAELLIKNGADLSVTLEDGDTTLHEACKAGHDKVVELLIKNGADLNVTDKAGDTALHFACRGGHDKVVELFIKNGSDLNVPNKDGDTALYHACGEGHDNVVKLLIKNGADLNVTNKDGDATLHEACRGGRDKIVELLIKNGADLKVTNGFGDKALHEACMRGHDKVVELLVKNGADLNVTNKYGDTALHRACWTGHDKVVELLIKNRVDLNVTDKAGDTALYHACKGGRDKAVELLIKNRADLNVTNKEHQRPIDVALGLNRDTELLLETETRKQAEYSELVSSVGSEEGTTVKLFLCGDGQVGKTSLREILNKTGFIVGAIWNLRRKFRRQDVFNPTPGVHVSSKTVPGIGRLSLHDFAGQAQFYVTHAMLLRTTNAIFPVVYKITDGEDEQKRQVHSWLTFIHCSNADPTNKPRIVLIASHADKLQDKQAGLRRATALMEHYSKLFQESLVVSQEVFLIDCMEARSSGIQRLREVLAAFRDDMIKQRPKACVQLSKIIDVWRKERTSFPVMGWQEYLTSVIAVTTWNLSQEVQKRIAQLASSYLHDEGEIIYLRNETDSMVVLDPQWLFTSVFGSLLAPDNFNKIIDTLKRTAEDYVTLEEITRVFSAVADIPLLIKLLQDFQLCHTYDGRTFILPSLLQQEMEEVAWSPVSSKAVYFGLQIRGRTEIDSFSCDLFPRLQTLLMQAHPDKLSRPLLWKNSAKCTDGKAEALLQITQDKRQLNIFFRSNDGNREDCNSIMDLLKDMTYRLLHETSPGARSRDMVLSALDLREHRPQPHAYSREEVEAAASKGKNLVHPQRNVPEKIKDVLLHIGNLKGMLGRVARKRPELVETLRHISPILDHLRADDVINMEENDRIRAARTPQDAARELLDILEAKGESACVKFHSVLQTCDEYAASLLKERLVSEEGARATSS